jgi:hypothetical protein
VQLHFTRTIKERTKNRSWNADTSQGGYTLATHSIPLPHAPSTWRRRRQIYPCISVICHTFGVPFARGLQASRRRILASHPHIVWPKPLKVFFCPMLQGSQPSPACPFRTSSTKIKLTMGTGGMILAGEKRSICRKPRPFVTGSGIEPGPPRGDTGDRPPEPRHTQWAARNTRCLYTRTTQFPPLTNTLRPHCNYNVFLQNVTSVSLTNMSSLQATPPSLLISNYSF